LIDLSLAQATGTAKSGYLYDAKGSNGGGTGTVNTTFSEGAIPQTVNRTGVNSYCAFDDAVIRIDTTGKDFRTTCSNTVSPLSN
jgi:hypothetical protein